MVVVVVVGVMEMVMGVDNHTDSDFHRCQCDPATSRPPDAFFSPGSPHQSPKELFSASLCCSFSSSSSSFSVLPPPLHLHCLLTRARKHGGMVVSRRRRRGAGPGRRGRSVLDGHDLRFLEKKEPFDVIYAFKIYTYIYIY